ncbi:GntR family transcriptional regulator, partial [Jatrophihabitans sp.]|uniref:FadR/GntR family transcriptional regulator n=1 Tax=Jatrophihabitans sp. TaxID=1932789 RepID=UPI0030C6B056|nr:FadR family transcriptional regulator [Jatrophihabitans sp.]
MTPSPRRAEGLAAQIESDIEVAGWPVGETLGSEIELCQRYGVGRGVLREAIRLLEHYSVARMKTGRGGGLVVCEPDVGVVARGAALLLRRMRVRPEHLIEARRTIEMTCVRVAAEEIDEFGVQRLRTSLAYEPDLTGRDMRSSRHEAGRFHV